MRKYLTEAVGTFFLVLTIVTSVRGGSPMAPLAIGAVLTAMVFAGGHISGAHYNPAVTLAVWVRGKVDTKDVPGYVAGQLIGAASAAGVGTYLVGAPDSAPTPVSSAHLAAVFVAEALVTAALATVVLNVATSADHEGNSFYGFAIGLTVLAGAVAVGPISGGVFNPAVAVGAGTAGMLSWSSLWIYLAADLLGGAAAALLFRYTNAHEWVVVDRGSAVDIPRPRSAPEAAVSSANVEDVKA